MDELLVRAHARTRFPTLNLALFLATVGTTLWAGYLMAGGPGVLVRGMSAGEALRALLAAAAVGLPFAASLVGILLAHEMGHYLLARRHRVDTTLPFFIPFLPYPIGTMGAVIRLRSPMPSRRATLDIGVAGPLAGFAVAVPLLLWGFAHSPVVATGGALHGLPSPLGMLLDWARGVPAAGPDGGMVLGDSAVTWLALRLTHGALAPGTDVVLHPVGVAAWFGLLVTALNLLPIGQLDGGHLTYALLGRARAEAASRLVAWGLLGLGLVLSWSWVGWWVIARFVVGPRHPPALEEEPLGRGRAAVAWLGLAILALTFAPIPIR